jgi:hypothetical protein
MFKVSYHAVKGVRSQWSLGSIQYVVSIIGLATIRKRTDLHLFHHGDSLGSYQSAEQGDYMRLIYL